MLCVLQVSLSTLHAGRIQSLRGSAQDRGGGVGGFIDFEGDEYDDEEMDEQEYYDMLVEQGYDPEEIGP